MLRGKFRNDIEYLIHQLISQQVRNRTMDNADKIYK